MTRRRINALVINPANPLILYAGTGSNGVYKTINGGTNWSAKNSGLPGSALVNALALDAAAPDVLYNVVKGCIYKTTNAAARWNSAGCIDA
jgi:photosystem II stability/assembly factor-like uncharacterized protein